MKNKITKIFLLAAMTISNVCANDIIALSVTSYTGLETEQYLLKLELSKNEAVNKTGEKINEYSYQLSNQKFNSSEKEILWEKNNQIPKHADVTNKVIDITYDYSRNKAIVTIINGYMYNINIELFQIDLDEGNNQERAEEISNKNFYLDVFDSTSKREFRLLAEKELPVLPGEDAIFISGISSICEKGKLYLSCQYKTGWEKLSMLCFDFESQKWSRIILEDSNIEDYIRTNN